MFYRGSSFLSLNDGFRLQPVDFAIRQASSLRCVSKPMEQSDKAKMIRQSDHRTDSGRLRPRRSLRVVFRVACAGMEDWNFMVRSRYHETASNVNRASLATARQVFELLGWYKL
jgi:hypothetical protein